MVAKTDGRYRRSLIKDLETPTSIALDPQLGVLYWAEAGAHPQIEVSWMDGSKRKVLVSVGLRHPTGLTVDHAMDHAIYWSDVKLNTIEMIRPDGTNRAVKLKGGE